MDLSCLSLGLLPKVQCSCPDMMHNLLRGTFGDYIGLARIRAILGKPFRGTTLGVQSRNP